MSKKQQKVKAWAVVDDGGDLKWIESTRRIDGWAVFARSIFASRREARLAVKGSEWPCKIYKCEIRILPNAGNRKSA